MASSAPVRQKNTDVPSGAATAARSASAGPFAPWQHRRQQSLGPRGRADRVSRLDAERGHCGAGRALTVRATSSAAPVPRPAATVAPAWSRCCPEWRNPNAPASPGNARAAVPSSTASSAKAKPPSVGTGGGDRAARRPGRDGRRTGSRPRVDSCSASSDRSASTAARCGFGLPEDVVEHLERQRPGVPGRQHVAEERGQVEGALAREQPVVPAPLQHVHVHVRRVGQLQEEQLLAGDLSRCRPDPNRGTGCGSCRRTARAQGGRRVRTMSQDRS